MGVFSDPKQPLAIAGLPTPGSDDACFQPTVEILFDEQKELFPNFLDSHGRDNPDISGIYSMNFTGSVGPHSISWWFDVFVKLTNYLDIRGVP
jgi:hypothetical protein